MADQKEKEVKKKKAKAKKKELAALDIVMSGCKTEKEKTLAKHLSTQIKKNNAADSENKTLTAKLKSALMKIDKLERTNKKSRDAVYKEQKIRTGAVSDQHRIKAAMAKIQKAVSARLKLLGIDFENITSIGEALDASLKAINSLVAQLQEKDIFIAKLESQIASLKKTIEAQKDKINYLEKKLNQQKKIIAELKDKLKERDARIEALEKENEALKAKNEQLEADLDALGEEFAKYKADTQRQMDEMKKTILDATQENLEKTSQIEELLQKIAELEAQNKQQRATIKDQSARIKELENALAQAAKELEEKDDRIKELLAEIERLKARIAELEQIQKKNEETIDKQSDRIAELEALLRDRDAEIEELKRRKKIEIDERDAEISDLRGEIERLKHEIERLLAIINYPRKTREVQTDISGAIDLQLNDYPRLLKEIVALKLLLEKKNKRIRDLEEENRMLMSDLEYLLKKAVAFYSDRSVHTGQVWNLQSCPSRYVVATGATDLSVRLWRINPNADKSKGEKTAQVFKCARIDGKIDSLAWNSKGTLLAAGTGYRDGAEGFVCVWNMEQGKLQYEVEHAIRSRPTLRFGRTYALCFSADSNYVYCGDTVGSIWCINLESERIVGLFQNHTDIVYDICADPTGTSLYSVSCDRTIAVIVIPEECGGMKGARDSYINDEKQDDAKDDYKSAPVKDVKKGKKGKKGKGKDKGKRASKKGKSSDKHLRNRSTSSAKLTPDKEKKFSSMTLKELLATEEDEFVSYDGIQVYKDDKYNFWRICVSADGKTIVTATRKLMIFRITGKDTIESGPNVSDMDNDHVKSLNLRNGYLLTARAGCTRAKLFSTSSGKEYKTIKCKKAICQSDFLCDDSYCVVLQQELVANQAPKPPSMKLYQYNKDGKARKVKIESLTPRPKTPVPSSPATIKDT